MFAGLVGDEEMRAELVVVRDNEDSSEIFGPWFQDNRHQQTLLIDHRRRVGDTRRNSTIPAGFFNGTASVINLPTHQHWQALKVIFNPFLSFLLFFPERFCVIQYENSILRRFSPAVDYASTRQLLPSRAILRRLEFTLESAEADSALLFYSFFAGVVRYLPQA